VEFQVAYKSYGTTGRITHDVDPRRIAYYSPDFGRCYGYYPP